MLLGDDRDLAVGRGKFDRIIHKIIENVLQPVGVHHEKWNIFFDLKIQLNGFSVGEGPVGFAISYYPRVIATAQGPGEPYTRFQYCRGMKRP